MPAPMLIGALAGSGLGLLENYRKREQEKDQSRANAMLAQVSPWNNMAARMMQKPERSGGLANIVQGGLSGAALGQGYPGAAEAAPMSFQDGSIMDQLEKGQPLARDFEMNSNGEMTNFGSAQRPKSVWNLMKPTYFNGGN